MHQLNPLTKLSLTGFLLALALAVPWWGTYLVLGLLVLPLAGWARVLGPLLRTMMRFLLPFIVPVFLIQGLFWTGGTPVLHVGPLSFKQEGLLFAVASLGRLATMVASFLLLSFTTRPDMLMQALVARGVPSQLLYLVVTTIQLVPRFRARANTILDAQRSRGLETEGGLVLRLRAIVPLIGPLIISSLVDVEERAIALEARGFNRPGPKTTYHSLPDSVSQARARAALLLAGVAAVMLRLYAAL